MLIITYYETITFLTVTSNALACFLFLYFNIKLQDNDKRYLNSFFAKLKRHISLVNSTKKCFYKQLTVMGNDV